jgi:autotransporter-associated beta strand protein
MKKHILIIASLFCLALAGATANAALSYWDSNGTTPGAGDTPNGTWNPADPGPYFWTVDPTGSSPTNAWIDGDTAVFCAGTDATNAYTVTVDPSTVPLVGGVIFSNGSPTVTDGKLTMTNEFLCPIRAQTDAKITSEIAGLFGTCGIEKTGPNKLTLESTASNYGGTNIVREGVLAVTGGNPTASSALGNASAPTVVSNGAALELTSALNISEDLILFGTGITNSGAFYARAGLAGNNGFTGKIILGSDSRIDYWGNGTWRWKGTTGVDGTNGGNNWNITFGGDGGTIWLNSTWIGNRCLWLGTGTITKDGKSNLRFEAASVASAFYWKEGDVTLRYPGFGTGPMYVSATAGYIYNANTTVSAGQPIVLAAGANPVWSITTAANTYTWSGVISGQGGMSVTNVGKLILTANNTYDGNTIILGNLSPASGAGTLVLSAGGKINNSPVIDVQQNALFDVSAVTGGYVLAAGQTLKGNGAITGNVTANGTIAPGASIGTLTFNNDLVINGNVAVEVDRDTPSSDSLAVTGLLTNAGVGAVLVTSVAGTLQAGDNFTLFSQSVLNGHAMAVVGGGVVWTNELEFGGKITALATAPVPATGLAATVTGATSVKVTGHGAANTPYAVYASTDVTKPMNQWTAIGAAVANGSGAIQFTDTNATGTQKFYRFGQ